MLSDWFWNAINKYIRYVLSIIKAYMAVWLSLTGRPFPSNDHERYCFVSDLEMTVCIPQPAVLLYVTPVQYIKNRKNILMCCIMWHLVWWYCGKEIYMLQLIAECMFCNFITKALFYAKYFDIFVTKVVFCLDYLYNCAAKPVISVTFLLRRKKNALNISIQRIISQEQMCSDFYQLCGLLFICQ